MPVCAAPSGGRDRSGRTDAGRVPSGRACEKHTRILQADPGTESGQRPDQASAVALSSFFMIEKMNAADSRQQTISTPQTAHSGIDDPHR